MGASCMKMRTDFKGRSQNEIRIEDSPLIDINRKINKRQDLSYVEARHAVLDNDVYKSSEDKQQIIEALSNHFIFISLTEEDKETISESMILYNFEAGDTVYEEERKSRNYFVLRSGLLEEFINGRKTNKITPGQGFGELALLHDNPRTSTVRCVEKSTLWGIERVTFRKVIEEMNTELYELNREFLERVNLLEPLASEQKDQLAVSLVSNKYYPGQKIITEGETGHHLYMIKEGYVSVQNNGVEVVRLKAGDYFGEMALLNNAPRNATCVAVEGPVKCVSLSRDTLQKTLGNKLQDIIERNTIMEALEKSETLSLLNQMQKEAIANDLEIHTYKGGDVVVQHGSSCKYKLYVIISGKLEYARTSHTLADKGTCIGDLYMNNEVEDQKYEDDMIAACDMKIGELTKYQFEVCIEGKYDQVVKKNEALKVLKKIHLFRHLSKREILDLLQIFSMEKFFGGETILREGFINDSIFIVKHGKVDIFDGDKLVRTALKHDYFGERGALFETCSKFTCVANGKVTLWAISNSDLNSILNELMRKQLLERIKFEDDESQLSQMVIVKNFESSGFRKNFLIKTLFSNEFYTLKVVSKRKIEKYVMQPELLVRFTEQEKRISTLIDHPFIAKLVKSFKCSKRIYFLMEFIHGISFPTLLKCIELLKSPESMFYIGSLVLVLEYLHERDIIYRDLRPDKILIDERGFVKLSSFNKAKIVQGKTYTLVGSPHYCAPEVIVGIGYTKNVDYWSLGICLYEFLIGTVPFGESESLPIRIYENILENELIFPTYLEIEEPAKHFIQKLLEKSPDARLANTDSIKKHLWFAGFNWDLLYEEKITPPYTPDVGDISEMVDESQPFPDVFSVLDKMSEESAEENYLESEDTELEEFRISIPQNWDDAF